MSVRILTLSAASALILAACSTTKNNPNYKHSTKYKASTPYSTTPSSRVVSASYPSSQYHTVSTETGYTRLDDQCLRSEKRREIVGGVAGGAIGAYAGKELIGDTKGAIAGGALGAAAGYGIGDKSINCDPIAVPTAQPTTITSQSYQGTTQYNQPQVVQSQAVQSQYSQPQVVQSQYSQPQYVTQPQPVATPVQQQQVYTAPTDQAYGNTVGTPGYHAMNAAQGAQPAPVQQPVYAQPQPQAQYVAPAQPVYIQQQPQTYVPTQVSAPQPTPQAVYGTAGMQTHQIAEGDTVYSMSKQLCVSVDEIRSLNNLDANYTIKLGQYVQLPPGRCR